MNKPMLIINDIVFLTPPQWSYVLPRLPRTLKVHNITSGIRGPWPAAGGWAQDAYVSVGGIPTAEHAQIEAALSGFAS